MTSMTLWIYQLFITQSHVWNLVYWQFNRSQTCSTQQCPLTNLMRSFFSWKIILLSYFISHDEDIINLWPLESKVLSLVNMTYRNELWTQQTNTILFVFVWKLRKLFLWSMAAASVHVFPSRHTGTLLDWEYWLQAFNGMQHHSTINLLIRTTVSICCRK